MINSRYSKWKIIARQVALESVRNTYLEDLHSTCDGFDDKKMRKLMLEIEKNLRISFWFWVGHGKYKDKELLKKVEERLFGEYGVSWDNPKLDIKNLKGK